MRGLMLAVIVIIGITLIAEKFTESLPKTSPTPRPTVTTRPTVTPRPELVYINALAPHVLAFGESVSGPLTTDSAQAALDTLAIIEQLQPPTDWQRFHNAIIASFKFCDPMLRATVNGDAGIADATSKLCMAGLESATAILNDKAKRR